MIAIALVGGGGLLVFLFGGGSKLTKSLGIGGSGVAGMLLAILTQTWKFLSACALGELGIPGYLFIGGAGLVVLVYGINIAMDVRANRQINPVK
jgi:hypothetical protein